MLLAKLPPAKESEQAEQAALLEGGGTSSGGGGPLNGGDGVQGKRSRTPSHKFAYGLAYGEV